MRFIESVSQNQSGTNEDILCFNCRVYKSEECNIGDCIMFGNLVSCSPHGVCE